MSAVLEAARGYLARGWAVVPIRPGQKRPKYYQWQGLRLKPEELGAHFGHEDGVGIILGEPSGFLVDVDLDCDEAVEMAEKFLPPTMVVTGRPSRPRTHWWYVATGCQTRQFRDKHRKHEAVVELRSTGAQTLVGPSLHPDGEFYDMLEGEPAVVDSQDLLQAVEKLHQAVMARRYPQEVKKADQVGGVSEVEHRARMYLEKFPEAVSGEGGHNRTYRAAVALVQGFCLSEDQALSALLAVYNPRCVPPWSEAELRHKVQEANTKAAATNRQPRGWLLSAKGVEADQVVVEDRVEADALHMDDPGPIPEHFLRVPGFIDEVMDYTLASAPYPNLTMAFCGALVLQGFLAGRKVRDELDNRTNLFILGLANSGAGKNYPRQVNQRILLEAGLVDCMGDTFASGEGLEDLLVAKPSVLFQTDEIDGLMMTISHGKESRYEGIMNTLMKMYTSANAQYPTRVKAGKEPSVIDQPSLCMFGTAVPQHYYEALSEKMQSNGFFARMLVLETGKRGKGQDPKQVSLPGRVVEASTWWAGFQPGEQRHNLKHWHPIPKLAETTPEAKEILAGFRDFADEQYDAFEANGGNVGMAIWARAHEKARRLALIWACSDGFLAPRITAPAATWACELVRHQTRQMLYQAWEHSYENEFHSRCNRLIAMLRSWRQVRGDAWMPYWEISRRLHWEEKDHDAVRSSLLSQRLIEYQEANTGGTPRRMYRLIGGAT